MARPKRPKNDEIITGFRALLTSGFYVVDDEGARREAEDAATVAALAATKSWRGEVWKAFREIDARMCPRPPREGERIEDDDENDAED